MLRVPKADTRIVSLGSFIANSKDPESRHPEGRKVDLMAKSKVPAICWLTSLVPYD
jgi:hypothetical protein